MRLLLDPFCRRSSFDPPREGVETENRMSECPFFRPVLMSGERVLSGYCTIPDRAHFGLDFSPPSFSTCLGRGYCDCPFYVDEMARRPGPRGARRDRKTRTPPAAASAS
jgi:hypothetical protein